MKLTLFGTSLVTLALAASLAFAQPTTPMTPAAKRAAAKACWMIKSAGYTRAQRAKAIHRAKGSDVYGKRQGAKAACAEKAAVLGNGHARF